MQTTNIVGPRALVPVNVNSTVSRRSKKNNAAFSKFDEARQQAQQLATFNNSMQADLRNAQQERRRLEETVQQQRAEIKQLRTNIASTHGQFDASQKAMAEIKKKVDIAVFKNSQIVKQFDKLQLSAKQTSADQQFIEEFNQSLASKCESIESSVAQFREQVADLKTKKIHAEAQMEEACKQQTIIAEKFQVQKETLGQLLDKNGKLEQSVAGLRKELDETAVLIKSKNQRLDEWKREASDLQAAVEESRRAAQQATTKLREVEGRATDALEDLERERAANKRRQAEFTTELADALHSSDRRHQQEIDELRTEHDRQREQLQTQLESANAVAAKDTGRLADQVDELESKLSQTRHTIDELTESNRKAEDSLRDAQENLAAGTEQAKELSQQLAAEKRARAKLQKRQVQLENDNAKLTDRLASATSGRDDDVAALSADRDRLARELADALAAAQKLENKTQDQQRRIDEMGRSFSREIGQLSQHSANWEAEKAKNAALTTKVRRLSDTLDERDRELATLNDRLAQEKVDRERAKTVARAIAGHGVVGDGGSASPPGSRSPAGRGHSLATPTSRPQPTFNTATGPSPAMAPAKRGAQRVPLAKRRPGSKPGASSEPSSGSIPASARSPVIFRSPMRTPMSKTAAAPDANPSSQSRRVQLKQPPRRINAFDDMFGVGNQNTAFEDISGTADEDDDQFDQTTRKKPRVPSSTVRSGKQPPPSVAVAAIRHVSSGSATVRSAKKSTPQGMQVHANKSRQQKKDEAVSKAARAVDTKKQQIGGSGAINNNSGVGGGHNSSSSSSGNSSSSSTSDDVDEGRGNRQSRGGSAGQNHRKGGNAGKAKGNANTPADDDDDSLDYFIHQPRSSKVTTISAAAKAAGGGSGTSRKPGRPKGKRQPGAASQQQKTKKSTSGTNKDPFTFIG